MSSGGIVLVVEDEVLIAMEIEDLVRDAGCDVLGPATSIERAFDILATTLPDAALLDINLNGKGVSPVASFLRQKGVPFALVTGYARLALDEPVLADAKKLRKPVDHNELRSVLGELLAASPGDANA